MTPPPKKKRFVVDLFHMTWTNMIGIFKVGFSVKQTKNSNIQVALYFRGLMLDD